MASTMTLPNIPPKTFDDLLTRVDEFYRVEDDDRAANKSNFKRDRGGMIREKKVTGRRTENMIRKVKENLVQRLLKRLTSSLTSLFIR